MPTPLLWAQMIQKHADAADATKELAAIASKHVPAYVIQKRVPIRAQAGLIAPFDISVPCGPIYHPKLEPYQHVRQSKTYQHLQTLNVPTSVGPNNSVDVTETTVIAKAGDVLGDAHADLVNQLGCSPFFDETVVRGSNEQVSSQTNGEVKPTAARAAGGDVPSASRQSVEAPSRPDGSVASLAERQREVTAELENAELARAILVAEIDAITQRKQNVESELEAATIAASEIQQECATFMRLREGEGTERYGSSKVKMNVTNEEFFGVW